MKKLINECHVRFSALAAVLVLSTVMLTTIDGSQNSVLAQNVTSTLLPPHLPVQDSISTPATPTGVEDDASSGSDSDNNEESASTPISPAPGITDSDDESSSAGNNNNNDDDSSDSSGSNDDDDDKSNDNDSQHTSSRDDDDDSDSQEETDETEDDFKQTSPLLQQIREMVGGALSANGIAIP